MAVAHRISVSFDDHEFAVLERLSAHTQKTKAELIRTIVEEYLREHPDRFRRTTTIRLRRRKNIVLTD